MDYIDKFLDSIETCYVPYEPKLRLILKSDLAEYTEDELSELFDLVRRSFPNSYKIAPDMYRFEEAIRLKFENEGLRKVSGHYEDIHRNVFNSRMEKIGHYDGGRFIPFLMNPAIKEKVLGLGNSYITPENYIEFQQELTKDIVKK